MAGIGDTLAPAAGIFSGGLSGLASYAWVLIPLAVIIGGFLIAWWIKKIKQKSSQWTHTLKVRRVLNDTTKLKDGTIVYRLSEAIVHRMRRFPLIKKAEVFELEKPLLGGYLLPELDEYSGLNEFSVILDKNNRIYTNKGEFFNPDANSVNVSAKHSEIDIQRQNLKANFQNINKISKRLEWSEIAKYAFMILAVIAIMIVSIVAIQNWGEAQEWKAQQAQAEALAMESLNDALETVQANSNTNILIIEKLKELYETQNLQSVINSVNKNV